MNRKPYYIEFKTNEIPGKLVATRVTLDSEIISNDGREMAINLCDDPLYPLLVAYVKANPKSQR